MAVATGVLNGQRVTMESLSFKPDSDTVSIQDRIDRAQPGEVIWLSSPPLSINVRIDADVSMLLDEEVISNILIVVCVCVYC